MSNNKAESQIMGRKVRAEMARHTVNCNEVQVTVSHGTVHLTGRVRALRGHEGTFDADLDGFVKSLRQTSGIRDVVASWTCIR
jgi:hypothetical protein